MAVDTTKLRSYSNGLVAVSGYGVVSPTLPTDGTTALNGALYREIGAVTENGISDATNQDFNDIYSWQGNALVASIPGKFTKTFKFAAQEVNGVTLAVQYGGSTLTQLGNGVSVAEKPPVRDVRTWVLHGISDSGKLQRIIVPLGQVSSRGDVVWASTDVTVYEWEVKCFLDPSGNVAYRYFVDSTLTL